VMVLKTSTSSLTHYKACVTEIK